MNLSRRTLLGAGAAGAGATVLAACGGGSGAGATAGGGGSGELVVTYWDNGDSSSEALLEIIENAKAAMESQNDGLTVALTPITSAEGDYATKLALMNRSPNTAPDIIYEDTYRINADVASGYLLAIDEQLSGWNDWSQFSESTTEGVTGVDGKTYGIPLDTDTRGLWYNKHVLEAAGIPLPWEPATWDDVLEAARTIKETQRDVVPFSMYAGKVFAEATSMQGFEMLLYGTEDTLYNKETSKWVTGAQGFVDALSFVETVFAEGIGPSQQNMADTNWSNTVYTDLFPADGIGISLDGSWVPSDWLETGTAPWPEWFDVVGWTGMPTQNGGDPPVTSMSGGWAFSIGAQSENPEAAFTFLTHLLNKENSLRYTLANASVPVRSDVAEDPEFTEQEGNPSADFLASLVEYTHFRPTTENYESVSAEIQKAMESVMTGQTTPLDAAAIYDEAVVGIVGDENVEAK